MARQKPYAPIIKLDKAEPIHPAAQGAEYICLHLIPMMTRPTEKFPKGCLLGNWRYDRWGQGVFENVLLCKACNRIALAAPNRVVMALDRKLVGHIRTTVTDRQKVHPDHPEAALSDCHCTHLTKRLGKPKPKKAERDWQLGHLLKIKGWPDGHDWQIMVCNSCLKGYELGFDFPNRGMAKVASAGR